MRTVSKVSCRIYTAIIKLQPGGGGVQGSTERPPRKVLTQPILLHNIYQLLPNRYQKNKSHSKTEAEVPPKKKREQKLFPACRQTGKGFLKVLLVVRVFRSFVAWLQNTSFFSLKGCLSENIKKNDTPTRGQSPKLQQLLLAKFARISKEV